MRTLLLAGFAALLLFGTAQAAVIYDFESSGAAFTYQSPTFVTADTTLGPADLATYSAGITSVELLPSEAGAGGVGIDAIQIERTDAAGEAELGFPYPSGTFGADGTYASLGLLFRGTLTVSGRPEVTVPEPPTYALLALPLCLTGLAVARRRRFP